MWNVKLYGIEWDDGKGEYDVSELPPNLEIKVEDDDVQTRDEAIERALEIASDEFDSLIDGTEQIVAKHIR
jgi:DNA-directed RNA polymerase subunit L